MGGLMKRSFQHGSVARVVRAFNETIRSWRVRPWPGNNTGEDIIVLTRERPNATITLPGVMVLVVAFLAFKGAVIADIGLDLYSEALTGLQHGALPERAGAFFMRPDAVSLAVAEKLSPMLR